MSKNMAQYQITWIDKPGGSQNPRTRIERVGGPGWADTAKAVIDSIIGKWNQFYVNNNGLSVSVGVAYRDEVPYLKTDSDGTPLDNLLYLTNVSTVK
jgi:hypothetical protein